VENEPRRTPRYSFNGTAEIIADNPNASATATVSELSLRGCRLDMKNSFPVNVPITVKISAAGELFESKGRIIYLQPGISAGVTFLAIEPQSRAVLRRWLDAAGKDAKPPRLDGRRIKK
jgi:PilZ domain-containing protein